MPSASSRRTGPHRTSASATPRPISSGKPCPNSPVSPCTCVSTRTGSTAFSLGRVEGHEITAESNGVTIHMDVGTAPRARGLSVDLEESLTGVTLKIDNPNAPAGG